MPNSGIDFILAKIPKEIHDLSHNPLPEQFSLQDQLHGEEKLKTQQNVAFAATSSPLEVYNNQKSKS